MDTCDALRNAIRDHSSTYFPPSPPLPRDVNFMNRRSHFQRLLLLAASTTVIAGGAVLPSSAMAATAAPHTATVTTVAPDHDAHRQHGGPASAEQWVETTDAVSGIKFRLPGKPDVMQFTQAVDGMNGRLYKVRTDNGVIVFAVFFLTCPAPRDSTTPSSSGLGGRLQRGRPVPRAQALQHRRPQDHGPRPAEPRRRRPPPLTALRVPPASSPATPISSRSSLSARRGRRSPCMRRTSNSSRASTTRTPTPPVPTDPSGASEPPARRPHTWPHYRGPIPTSMESRSTWNGRWNSTPASMKLRPSASRFAARSRRACTSRPAAAFKWFAHGGCIGWRLHQWRGGRRSRCRAHRFAPGPQSRASLPFWPRRG